ncbi:MAG: RNA-dependent DNA polymerase [FCB group bacterium]|nr:RNA-dependent DNA polymerase [FCB group bacterium]
MNYQKVTSLENLYEAVRQTVRSKRTKQDIAEFLFHLEDNVELIHQDLKNKKYFHSGYEIFEIIDPKKRTISKASVRDRVVHHAVHSYIYPILDKSFITHSYACRKGKGTHKAIILAQKHCRTYQYAIHLDIVKYFESINRNILKNILQKKLSDKKNLELLFEIIDSSAKIKLYSHKGLPLGNLTSQLFANLYLNELDQFVKHNMRIKPFIRYMDDMLIFGNNKNSLLESAFQIEKFTQENLELSIHKKCFQVLPVANGIAFLGFRIFPFYRKVLPKGLNRFRNRLKQLKKDYENNKIELRQVSMSIQSSLSFLKFGNTASVRKELMKNSKFIRRN